MVRRFQILRLDEALMEDRSILISRETRIICPICDNPDEAGCFISHLEKHGLDALESSFAGVCPCGFQLASEERTGSGAKYHRPIWEHWRKMGVQHIIDMAVEAALKRAAT